VVVDLGEDGGALLNRSSQPPVWMVMSQVMFIPSEGIAVILLLQVTCSNVPLSHLHASNRSSRRRRVRRGRLRRTSPQGTVGGTSIVIGAASEPGQPQPGPGLCAERRQASFAATRGPQRLVDTDAHPPAVPRGARRRLCCRRAAWPARRTSSSRPFRVRRRSGHGVGAARPSSYATCASWQRTPPAWAGRASAVGRAGWAARGPARTRPPPVRRTELPPVARRLPNQV